MKHRSPLPRLLFFGLLCATLACGGGPKDETAAPETSPASPPTDAVAGDSPAGSDDSSGSEAPKITPFGVPECDTYVQKYLDCVQTRVSGEARDRLLESFEANRTKWRALATMQQGAIALAVACKAATQKAKEALAVDYGCEF